MLKNDYKNIGLFLILAIILLLNPKSLHANPLAPESNIEWDENGTRYQLILSTQGSNNWIFLPGGAGADSCYFLDLINFLQLPGKSWVIDFPSNGSNIKDGQESYQFDEWDKCLLNVISKFEKPILIGHSFGGMFPFLFPELENLLKGFISIGTAPKIDPEENQKMINARNIIFSTAARDEFNKNPNNETFKKALLERSACHFPPSTLEKGKHFFETLLLVIMQ